MGIIGLSSVIRFHGTWSFPEITEKINDRLARLGTLYIAERTFQ